MDIKDSLSKGRPNPENFGWYSQSGFDGEPSGWMIEGGEDAYYNALNEWNKNKEAGIPTLNVKVKEISVLITDGTDIISIVLDEETSFPDMKYNTLLKLECQKGYGEEYCKRVLGLTPKIILNK